jgi:hypothetical protein
MEASGQPNAPAALPQGKSPWYPLDRRLGGPQSRSGRGVKEKNSQPLLGLEPRSSNPQTLSTKYHRNLFNNSGDERWSWKKYGEKNLPPRSNR